MSTLFQMTRFYSFAFALLSTTVQIVGCSTENENPVGLLDGGNESLESKSQTVEAEDVRDGLLEAREGFNTTLIPNSYEPGGRPPEPPQDKFQLVKYPSEVGELAAFLTPAPADNRKYPAIIWAHGGFGGIGDWFWGPVNPLNDQTASAFRADDIVLMIPSWRGENDNPGTFQLFYGEVNDLLSAREYLAKLPYVDENRIYLAGHSTGGTMALLSATACDKFRAVFSFGGSANIQETVSNGVGYGNTPFDIEDPDEGRLRSAINFVDAISTPTFYFEGADSSYVEEARRMEALAKSADVPFTTCIIDQGSHFSILAPLTDLIARKIRNDNGKYCNIAISEKLANLEFESFIIKHKAKRLKASQHLPLFQVSPAALSKIKQTIIESGSDLETTFLKVERESDWSLQLVTEIHPTSDETVKIEGLTVVVPKTIPKEYRGFLLDFVQNSRGGGFKFIDPLAQDK